MRASAERSVIIREFSVTSLFVAIIFLLSFTPLGFISLPLIKGTITHVPVIIGSILLGPKIGACLGAMFGLASLINNTVNPSSILSFAFSPAVPVPGTSDGSLWALVICFIPRILVGIVPWYVDKFVTNMTKGNKKSRIFSVAIAGIAGSATNTLLVTHLIFFIFKDAYALAKDVPVDAIYGFVIGIMTVHGIPEAIIAAILAPAVCKAVESYRQRGSAL
jgi:uncharacterized membrane protein